MVIHFRIKSFYLSILKFQFFSLIKSPDERASCNDLLEHEFIKKYADTPNDLQFIKKVMDEVKKDIVEP